MSSMLKLINERSLILPQVMGIIACHLIHNTEHVKAGSSAGVPSILYKRTQTL